MNISRLFTWKRNDGRLYTQRQRLRALDAMRRPADRQQHSRPAPQVRHGGYGKFLDHCTTLLSAWPECYLSPPFLAIRNLQTAGETAERNDQ